MSTVSASELAEAVPSDVTPAHVGPCTEERARELVSIVISSVNSFQEAMDAILRERAWEPLGYRNPAELVKNEIIGQIINPQTGKPYGRTQFQKAIREMMLRFVIAEDLGIDASDLVIPWKLLKSLPAGHESRNDLALVQQVEDAVRAATTETPPAAEDVQKALDSVLAQANGIDEQAAESRTEPSMGAQAAFAGGADESHSPAAAPQQTLGRGEAGPADAYSDSPADNATAAATPPTDLKAVTQKDAHRDGTGDSSDMKAVLSEMKQYEQWVKVLEQCAAIGKLMPSIEKVRAKLPEFIDNCDDDDLGHLTEALEGAKVACVLAQDVMLTFSESMTEVEGRMDDAGY